MALYKLNTFHWHLTDDQGWRVEVRSRPRLTEVGSRRSATPLPHDRHQSDGTPYGGHYTQDQVRQVVAYAAARGITVVPEIEMPGHALAALASYPELGCRGAGYEVGTSWGIKSEVLCAGRESTFSFLEEVLSEVLELFPSPFIPRRWRRVPQTELARVPALPGAPRRRGTARRRRAAELVHPAHGRVARGPRAAAGRLGRDPGRGIGSGRDGDELARDRRRGGRRRQRPRRGDVAPTPTATSTTTSHVTRPRNRRRSGATCRCNRSTISNRLHLPSTPPKRPTCWACRATSGPSTFRAKRRWSTWRSRAPWRWRRWGWTPAARRSAGQFEERLRTHRPLLDRLGVHYRPWEAG